MTAAFIFGATLGVIGMLVIAWSKRATEDELVAAQAALARVSKAHRHCERDAAYREHIAGARARLDAEVMVFAEGDLTWIPKQRNSSDDVYDRKAEGL